MGLLSHAVADLRYPLHTDADTAEQGWIQEYYNNDTLLNLADFSYTNHGITLWPNPYDTAVSLATAANRFYYPLLWAYAGGNGYSDIAFTTKRNVQMTIADIVNAWTTALAAASASSQSFLALQANQDVYTPGDTLQLSLSSTALPSSEMANDLYVALFDTNGAGGFLTSNSTFVAQATPFRQGWRIPTQGSEQLLTIAVPPSPPVGTFSLYAVLVAPGADPGRQEGWRSNLAAVDFKIESPEGLTLTKLRDEIYLFPGRLPGSNTVVALPLKRWDFVFLGDLPHSPPTSPEDESWTDTLIPGEFNHTMVYLGRDEEGNPWGMEMTTQLASDVADLRMVRFPEFDQVHPDVVKMNLSVGPKNIWRYRVRWAKRLNDSSLTRLKSREYDLLRRLREDWAAGFPYQLEFNWSGSVLDTDIFLVDDGRTGGASCTDYWLSFYEQYAGVCIHGTRMTASEFAEYFRNDPIGMTATVLPEFNPFPFAITMGQAMDMGFRPLDPPAHVFPCDGSRETGLPLPQRLLESPQLKDITPVPAPPEWEIGEAGDNVPIYAKQESP